MSDSTVAAAAREYVTEKRHMQYHEAESGNASQTDRYLVLLAYNKLKAAVDAEAEEA